MKRIFALTVLAAPAAQAHTLDPAGGILTALEHQLLGSHHLPLSLLLVVVGVALFRVWRKRAD